MQVIQIEEKRIKKMFITINKKQIEIIEMKEEFENEYKNIIGEGVQLIRVSDVSKMIEEIDVTQELKKYGAKIIFLNRNELKELEIRNISNHNRLRFVTLTDLKFFLLKKGEKEMFSILNEKTDKRKKLDEIEAHEKPSPFRKVTDELEVIQNKARLYDEIIEKQKKIKEKVTQNTEKYFEKLIKKEGEFFEIITETFREIAENIEKAVEINEILEINKQFCILKEEFGYVFNIHESIGDREIRVSSEIKEMISRRIIELSEN